MPQEKNIEKAPEKSPALWRRPRAILALGLTAVSLAFAAYDSYDRSGEITSYDPIKKGSQLIDNKLKVLNWNMHNETSDKYGKLDSIIDKYDVDVVTLQEVSADDAKGLHKYFPDAYIKFAMADAKTKFLEGGYGNVLMTFQEQIHTTSVSIEGNATDDAAVESAGAIIADVSNFNTSFKHTKEATQEDRTALASSVKVQKGEDLAGVRIITGHIGAPQDDIHERQFDELKDYLKNNAEEEKGAVFCGDVNFGSRDVIPSYLRIGFYVHQTKRTTPEGFTPDYCAYHPGDVFGEGEVIVLGNKTDHYALLGSWKTTP